MTAVPLLSHMPYYGLSRSRMNCKASAFAWGWYHKRGLAGVAPEPAPKCFCGEKWQKDAFRRMHELRHRQVQRAFVSAAGASEAACELPEGQSSTPPRQVDQPREGVSRLVRRYAMLRPEDRRRLVQQHASGSQREVKNWDQFRLQNMDERLLSWEDEKRKRQEQTERVLRLREMYKPSHLRRRKQKVKRVQQSEDQSLPVVAANFTDEAQTLSLIEDVHKAEVYEKICATLDGNWMVQDPLSDRFFDVLAQAVRQDLMDQSRPTLVNEFTDFDNPYMLKRQAIKRLLEERGTRNALDESLIDKYLEKRSDLVKLRLGAKLPPEVVEPLVAFQGLTNYSFDKRTRLGQKVDAVQNALKAAQFGMDRVLEVLPENQRSDRVHRNHPFRNHFGFASAVPWGTVGSVSMGAEKSGIEKELEQIRYPTLQRVAHTLPKDPKYRAIVAHAIRVLERSRGWGFENKVKAISTLIEVYNSLPPSAVYESRLDRAFPVLRKPGMTRQTQPRNSVYCRGLKYIRSLTTQKPLAVRLAKKK